MSPIFGPPLGVPIGHPRLGRLLGLLLVSAFAVAAAAAATPSSPESIASVHQSAAQFGPSFRVATFNMLGASHTRHHRRGFDTYDVRMPRAIELMNDNGFGIVGLQEFQYPQYQLFTKLVGDSWGVYPGLEVGRRPVQNSIVWRTSDWRIVEKHTFQIPYFHGNLVAEPYIKLRNVHTGADVWVINTHNPADARGPAQQWRDEAVRREIALANQLRTTGVPVLMTGDFNDRAQAYCPITAQTELKAAQADGGWFNGSCVTPRYSRIDWVFASTWLLTTNYTSLNDAFVDTITDHPVNFSDVAIPTS